MITIQNRVCLGNMADLTTPTSTRKYVLGTEIIFENSASQSRQVYKYVKSHTTLVQYQPYEIVISGTAGSEVITAAPSTLASPGALVGVPQVAFTSGYYGFVLIEGDGIAKVAAETYAAGDMLQVLTTGTTFVVDGTSGATVFSVNTSAVIKETGSTATSRNVYLYGKRAVIAAT